MNRFIIDRGHVVPYSGGNAGLGPVLDRTRIVGLGPVIDRRVRTGLRGFSVRECSGKSITEAGGVVPPSHPKPAEA